MFAHISSELVTDNRCVQPGDVNSKNVDSLLLRINVYNECLRNGISLFFSVSMNYWSLPPIDIPHQVVLLPMSTADRFHSEKQLRCETHKELDYELYNVLVHL